MREIFYSCEKPIKLKTGQIVTCGSCRLCRRRRQLDWVLRGTHELNAWKNKALFLTLSYKPKFLPKEGYKNRPIERRNKFDVGGNLVKKDIQDFIKRLRKNSKEKLKYIACGEYGLEKWRPHYHLVIFGIEPDELYTESYFKKLWGKGRVWLSPGRATERAIFYTVGYVAKKIMNEETKEKNYYSKGRIPPFLLSSKGFGKKWALNNVDDWTQTLKIAYQKKEFPVPRYYIKLIKKLEGRTIRFKKIIKNEFKVLEESYQYKIIENPFGKYTSKIEMQLIRKKYKKLQDEEKNIEDDFYFENVSDARQDLKIAVERLEQLSYYWVRTKDVKDYKLQKRFKIVRNVTEEFERLEKRRKKYRKIKDPTLQQNIERGFTTVQEKIKVYLNSPYGKRQGGDLLE